MKTEKQLSSRIETILSVARSLARKLDAKHKVSTFSSYVRAIEIHYSYSERGSDSVTGFIATGNWNVFKVYTSSGNIECDINKRVGELFQKLGVDTEWSDEWMNCDNCEGLVRHKCDSHSWKPSYVETESGVLCHKCEETFHDSDYLNTDNVVECQLKDCYVDEKGRVFAPMSLYLWEDGKYRTISEK